MIAEHAELGRYVLACEAAPELLFTENETNLARLYGAANSTPYVKDGINEAVVLSRAHAVNPATVGTKAAAHYRFTIEPGETATVRLRLRREAGDLRRETRACYALPTMKVMKRLSISIAKARKCKPARVSGNRS